MGSSVTTHRPENSAILGVSMPLELKRRIKALADADKRSMASWAVIHLEAVVAEIENQSSLAKVAEPLGNESSRSSRSSLASIAPPIQYPTGRRHKND